jgi:DNA replication protein DnaC
VTNDNVVRDALKTIIESAEERNPVSDKDYVGEDGLVYCGNCRTRKQFRMNNPITEKRDMVVPIPCECKKEKIAQEEAEKALREHQDRIKALRKESMMDGALSTERFETAIKSAENEKSMRVCRKYAENFDDMLEKNQGLLLMGDVGTGKTFAAACIANYLLDKGVPCVMTTFIRLISLTKPYDSDEADDVINTMLRVPLLIIDDLGAQRDTSYATERVYDFINRRTLTNKPMIVTTNITDPKELTCANGVGERRIYDRILQCCAPIVFTGKSWRLQEARDRAKKLEKDLGIE